MERAAALPDGGALELADGRVVHVGHRRLREGARVALLHIPTLLRFDVERLEDTFSSRSAICAAGTSPTGHR